MNSLCSFTVASQHRLVAAITMAAVLPAVAGEPYGPRPVPDVTHTLIELAIPEGCHGSRAFGVNPVGGVVGSIETSAGDSHAVVWVSPSSIPVDLGAEFGESCARAMNRHGVVVGVADGFPVAWVPDSAGYRAVILWSRPGVAHDINKHGVIIGTVGGAGNRSHAFVIVPEHRDHDGGPEWFRDKNPADERNDLLVRLDGESGQSSGLSINNFGWTVAEPGELIRPQDRDGDGRIDWFCDEDDNAANDLSTPLPWAGDINNELQIASANLVIQIRVGTGGELSHLAKVLPKPQENLTVVSEAINDAGVVVGHCTGPNLSGEAFRWETGTGTCLLRQLVSDMGMFLRLDRARDVNFADQIAGTGTTAAGERAFLATPTTRGVTAMPSPRPGEEGIPEFPSRTTSKNTR